MAWNAILSTVGAISKVQLNFGFLELFDAKIFFNGDFCSGQLINSALNWCRSIFVKTKTSAYFPTSKKSIVDSKNYEKNL